MPRDAAAAEEGRQAGRRAQNAVNDILHGARSPDTILRPKRGGPAPAGPYELLALVWHEPKRDEHGRKFTVKHVRGEIVELSASDAERLLRAGAVAPTTSEQEASDAAQEETALEKATQFAEEHGPTEAQDGDDHEPVVAKDPGGAPFVTGS